MEALQLRAHDITIPAVGVGTSSYSGGPEPLRRAIELGASFIDTAEIYGSEETVGEAVRGMRDRAFIATKVWNTNLRHDDLKRALEASLQRLGTDYVDLYQVHWPNSRVPIAETIGAMEELVDAGMVRYLGVSNFNVRELEAARAAAKRHPIVSNQVSFSLTDRRAAQELLPYCRAHGIALIAYSPLGRGLERMRARDRHGVLDAVAAETGRTPAQVALNWCISHEGVSVIPKANSVGRIEENCGAAGWRLEPGQMERLEGGIRQGRPPYRRRGPLEAALRARARRVLDRTGLRRRP